MRLNNKVAIITGGASGFGEGMAKRFAEEGAKVVVADLNAKGAERVAGEIGKAAIATTTDVSQRAEIDEMVYAAMQAFGRIDIMVNNAGYTHRNGDLLGVDEQTFDLIAEHRITLTFGVPAMFQQIALSPRWASADLSSLRILHCGGAPVPTPLIRIHPERIVSWGLEGGRSARTVARRT